LVFDEITFSTRPASEVDIVAVRALSLLAANTGNKAPSSSFKSLADHKDLTKMLTQRLYQASCDADRQKVITTIKEMQVSQASVSDIISILVPAAARKLGQDWVNDTASFGTVTIGCARLQACVHHLERNFAERPLRDSAHQSNCLVVVPEGAQHTLGAVVLAAELRQAGPHAQLALDVSPEKMARLVNDEHYDIVMISAALGQDIGTLRALVKAARTKDAHSKVIIGGSLLTSEKNLRKTTLSDAVTSDWQTALKIGNSRLQSVDAKP